MAQDWRSSSAVTQPPRATKTSPQHPADPAVSDVLLMLMACAAAAVADIAAAMRGSNFEFCGPDVSEVPER